MFVLNDDLAIEDCGAAFEIGGSLNDTGVTVAPIKSVAGISAGLTSLHNKERAVSVVLDLVNPTTPQRRLIYEGCQLRLNEAQPRGCQRHGNATSRFVPGSRFIERSFEEGTASL